MFGKKLRVISVIFVLAFLLSFAPNAVYAQQEEHLDLTLPDEFYETASENDIPDYKKVSQNSNSILYADMEKGWFALENRLSGDIWYSTPIDFVLDEITSGPDMWTLNSQLVLSYVFTENLISAENTQNITSHRACVDNGTVKVSRIDGGISVEYGFEEIDVTVPVRYILKDDHLLCSINTGEIKEGKESLITAINLLPAFGAGNWASEGELLVPDGSGALIQFNNGREGSAYESPVYGSNLEVFKEIDSSCAEDVRMPVFATIMKNKALMGIITEGDCSSSIRAMNGNPARGYNAVSGKFTLRSLETLSIMKHQLGNGRRITKATEKISDKFEIRYYPLHGQDTDYVDVAAAYRNYLVKEKSLKANPEKPALALDVYGSVEVKSAILGIEYNKQVSLTTFKQAEQIVGLLEKKGVDSLSLRYSGWGNGGMLNKKIPDKAVAMSALGGKSGFNSLAAYLSGKGHAFYPNIDFMQFRSGSSKKAVKNAFNESVERNLRLRSVYVTRLGLDSIYLLTPQEIVLNADKYLRSYKKLKVSGISLDTLGQFVYSNNGNKNNFHLYYFGGEIEKTLEKYKNAELSIALDNANAYTLAYAGRIYNAPVVCSGYDMFDREIPFYQLVTHGFVTSTSAPVSMSSGRRENILKAVESGSELLYGCMYKASTSVIGTRYDNLYSTQYSLWIDEAAAEYKRYQPFLELVYDKVIISHSELIPGVMQTVFEGGASVIVNFNREEVTVNGKTVGGEDYLTLTEGNI